MIEFSLENFINTLISIITGSPTSILFIILGIIFTIAMIINIKKNKTVGKTLFIIGWIFIILFIVIKYNGYISKLFDNLINTIFMQIFFPNLATYIIIITVTNVIFLYTILNKKSKILSKITNSLFFSVIMVLMVYTLDLIIASKINIYEKNELYTNKQVLTLIEATTIIFSIWIIIILSKLTITKLINKSNEKLLEQENEKITNNQDQPIEQSQNTTQIEPVQPIEQIQNTTQIEPVQPIEQIQSPTQIESVKPIEQSQNNTQIEPVQPIEQIQSPTQIEPVQPVEQIQSPTQIESVNPIEQSQNNTQIESVKPIEQSQNNTQIEPVKPIEQIQNNTQIESVKPIEQTQSPTQIEPVKPIEQSQNNTQIESVKPIEQANLIINPNIFNKPLESQEIVNEKPKEEIEILTINEK